MAHHVTQERKYLSPLGAKALGLNGWRLTSNRRQAFPARVYSVPYLLACVLPAPSQVRFQNCSLPSNRDLLLPSPPQP
jgi:hypothetical protein